MTLTDWQRLFAIHPSGDGLHPKRTLRKETRKGDRFYVYSNKQSNVIGENSYEKEWRV
jgi:hypothetical protein